MSPDFTKNRSRYDKTTVRLHWVVALTVVFQWLGASVIDWFPRGPLKVDARSVHILVGVLLLLTIIFRLYWRSFRGVRVIKPVSHSEQLASLVHAGQSLRVNAFSCSVLCTECDS